MNKRCSNNVQRFRGGLVFKANRLLYHSTLGLRIIKRREEYHVALVHAEVVPLLQLLLKERYFTASLVRGEIVRALSIVLGLLIK